MRADAGTPPQDERTARVCQCRYDGPNSLINAEEPIVREIEAAQLAFGVPQLVVWHFQLAGD